VDKKISELPVLTDIRGARYPVEKSGLNYKVSPFSNYLFTTSGTANNYTLTVDGISSYFNGLMIVMQFNVNNTGPSVININGLGSKSIVKEGSSPVSAGDLPANKAFILIYDGTNFKIIGSLQSGGSNLVGGANIDIDNTDPNNPVISVNPDADLLSARNITAKIPIEPDKTTNARQLIYVPISRTVTSNDSLLFDDMFKKLIVDTTGGGLSITIPPSTFAEGDVVYVERRGSNSVTFVAGTGVTINTSLGALTDGGEYMITPIVFDSPSTATIHNGTPSTGVPTSRTIAGLDLSTNRTSSELMVAMGVILSNIIRGSSNDRYHCQALVMGTGLSTTALTVSKIRASPFIVGRNLNIDRIQAEVTTVGTSAVFRLGIYADNGNCYPDNLIVDSGELDGSTTGVKNATISASLTPGLYWLVSLVGTATVTFRSLQNQGAGLPSVMGWPAAMGATIREPFWEATQTYGALPSTFPTGATINSSALNSPLIMVRA